VNAEPGTPVSQERGQPSQRIQRPLGQGAAEGNPVMISARLPVTGGNRPQDEVIVTGQGERVTAKDVLVDVLYPLHDLGCRPPDRGVRATVQRDPHPCSRSRVTIGKPVEGVQQACCGAHPRWRGQPPPGSGVPLRQPYLNGLQTEHAQARYYIAGARQELLNRKHALMGRPGQRNLEKGDL
jgi:hypothetical protein